jgi:hypothetical protein
MIEKYKEALREAFQDFDLLDFTYSIEIESRLFDISEFGRIILKVGDYSWLQDRWGSYSDLDKLYHKNIIKPNQKDITLYKIMFNFKSKIDYSKSKDYRSDVAKEINNFKETFDECIEKANYLVGALSRFKYQRVIFTNPFIYLFNHSSSPRNRTKTGFSTHFTIFILGNKTLYRDTDMTLHIGITQQY